MFSAETELDEDRVGPGWILQPGITVWEGTSFKIWSQQIPLPSPNIPLQHILFQLKIIRFCTRYSEQFSPLSSPCTADFRNYPRGELVKTQKLVLQPITVVRLNGQTVTIGAGMPPRSFSAEVTTVFFSLYRSRDGSQKNLNKLTNRITITCIDHFAQFLQFIATVLIGIVTLVSL